MRFAMPLFVFLASVVARAEEPAAQLVTRTRAAMGTKVQILVWTADPKGAEPAIDAAFAEIDRLEGLLSEWKPDSEIAKLNRTAGSDDPLPVSPETVMVLMQGKQVSTLSNGAFSLTWAALAPLWSFGDGPHTVPDPMKAVQKAALIDDSALVVDAAKNTAHLGKPGMAVGVGGIAKGYASDRALAVLKSRGYPNALLAASGDIATSGAKGERPWLVGIQDPRAAGYFATITLKDEAVSTSGDYEQYFEVGGTRYHHILDPRTGYPAQSGSRSVTIIAKDGVVADAFATAVFVLGPVDGMKLVEAQPGIGAIIVDQSSQVSVSSSLKDRVRVLREPTRG